jgi:hypothetical protein
VDRIYGIQGVIAADLERPVSYAAQNVIAVCRVIKDLESKEAFGFFCLNRLFTYADFVDNLFFQPLTIVEWNRRRQTGRLCCLESDEKTSDTDVTQKRFRNELEHSFHTAIPTIGIYS